MESQGLSHGSLRNSHREVHAIRRKPAAASFQELASKLVESCSEDLLLRQRLDPDKLQGVLKRGTFYVLENDGRGEPGFLVFLPGKPAIYLQRRRGRGGEFGFQGSTLRMRASTSLGEGGGTVLIATLDDVMHTLRLEDVWMWRGTPLASTTPYSKRREKLQEFVERHWVPDARLLGGIFTKIAQPMSLEQFSQKGSWEGCSSVEFLPEQPGRRRMVWHLETIEKAATGHAGLKQERGPVVAGGGGPTGMASPPAAATAPAVVAPPAAPPQLQRLARAVPVEKLPDVYDLFGEDGMPISRASVQQFALSQALRAQKGQGGTAEGIWVTARWRSEFGGYEIIKLSQPHVENGASA